MRVRVQPVVSVVSVVSVAYMRAAVLVGMMLVGMLAETVPVAVVAFG